MPEGRGLACLIRPCLIVGFCVFGLGFCQDKPPHSSYYKVNPGPFAVETIRHQLSDSKRGRPVPLKVYYPDVQQGLFPVIIFSHALGCSREDYEYLGRHWASHGYICVHLQHKGSDGDIWLDRRPSTKAMRELLADANNTINRALDVCFVVDELNTLNKKDGPLKGKLDMDNIGMAGHSFGAQTALVVAGELLEGPRGRTISYAEPRIKAAIVMSPSVPTEHDRTAAAYTHISVPILHMTGTLDGSSVTLVKAKDRRIPFDSITGPEQYLVIFKGGDHAVFSGHKRYQCPGRNDAVIHRLIRSSSTAFWDAYLKSDEKAKRWLAGGGFDKVLADAGTFEKKNLN